MALTQGGFQAYDFNRMVVLFTMMNDKTEVPCAIRIPPFATVMFSPAPSCTVVPGWIVKVTPLLMVTLPQTMTGLLLAYQVVFTAMAPLTQFAALVSTVAV